MTASTGTLTYPIWTGSTFQTVSMPYATNPDLPVSRHVLPQDYVGRQGQSRRALVDLDGHGTHVSGTIGEETNNAFLVSGMAYNVRIMPVKVCSRLLGRHDQPGHPWHPGLLYPGLHAAPLPTLPRAYGTRWTTAPG